MRAWQQVATCLTVLVTSTGGDAGAQPAWFACARAWLIFAAVGRVSDPAFADVLDDSVSARTELDAARDEFRRALGRDEAFTLLAGNVGLDVASAEVFALLAAAEIDDDLRTLVSGLHGDGQRRRLTLGLLRKVFGPDHAGPMAVASQAPLRRCAFVDVNADGPWSDHEVALHPGIVWTLAGDASSDPDLPDDAESFECGPEAPAGQADTEVLAADVVVVNGIDAIRRREAGAWASIADLHLCAQAPEDDRGWAALVREATITGRGIIIEVERSLSALGRRWIERATHLPWVISAATGPALAEVPRRSWSHVVAGDADPTDAEWAVAFGDAAPRRHRLTPDQMHRVSTAFRHTRTLNDAGDAEAIAVDIDSSVRRLASGTLETLTTRIAPRRTWNDVVVSPDRLRLLEGIVERYRNSHRVYEDWGFTPDPSRGLVALFSGPSGTGKTLTAEVIAGDLGLDLFKLDLSSVVSKYIGETEKNLEQIFDAASAGNMVLFFDEADSLFGKRSEVRDARDRYANIEVSYLLQRLETYDGLIILATNLEKNIDDAFLRRIHARVQFAVPGVEERLAIWRHNLPGDAPLDEVDLDWLAGAFELAGGVIRNAAVQAAFLAAQTSRTIRMEHLVIGVALELRKSGRLLNPSDFGEYHEFVNL